MMKSKIAALSAVATAMSLALAAPAASAVEVGVGAGITGGEGGANVYVPIRFGNFRIEPELNYYSSTDDYTYSASPANNHESEYSWYSLGSGFYWRQLIGSSLETYVGGRVGFQWWDYSNTYPNNPASNNSEEQSGYYIGPTIGAEYFFHKQFSIGLDVSLIYSSGSRDYTSAGTVSSGDSSDLNTEARTTLRYYFGP